MNNNMCKMGKRIIVLLSMCVLLNLLETSMGDGKEVKMEKDEGKQNTNVPPGTRQEGVYFEPVKTAYIGTGHWTIVVDVSARHIENAIFWTENSMETLRGQVQRINDPTSHIVALKNILEKELSYLGEILNRVNATLKEIQETTVSGKEAQEATNTRIKTPRMKGVRDEARRGRTSKSKSFLGAHQMKKKIVKRGLFNFVGKGLKFLFGVADSSDVRAMNKQVDVLRQSAAAQQHALHGLLTVVNHTRTQVILNAKLLKDWNEILKQMASHVQAYESIIWFNSATRLLGTSVLELYDEVLEFSAAINMLTMHRMSHYFLPASVLQKYLVEVSTMLTSGETPIFGHLPTDLHRYYKIVDVTTVALPSGDLRLFAKIPLKSNEDLYRFYKISTYPISDLDTGLAMKYVTEHSYFGIQIESQNYILLNEDDMGSCLNSDMMICNGPQVIWYDPMVTCEFALFSADTVKAKALCTRQVLRNPLPVFLKISDNDWLYSIFEELQMRKVCKNDAQLVSTAVRQILPRGVGIINIPTGCSIDGRGIKLNPLIVAQKFDKGISHKVIFPPLADLLGESENLFCMKLSLLLNDHSTNDDIQQNFLSLDNGGATLKEVKHAIERSKRILSSSTDKSFPYIWLCIGLIAVIGLILFGSLFCYSCKGENKLLWKTMLIRRRKTRTPTTLSIEHSKEVMPINQAHVEPEITAEF